VPALLAVPCTFSLPSLPPSVLPRGVQVACGWSMTIALSGDGRVYQMGRTGAHTAADKNCAWEGALGPTRVRPRGGRWAGAKEGLGPAWTGTAVPDCSPPLPRRSSRGIAKRQNETTEREILSRAERTRCPNHLPNHFPNP
jgi:hypothetical protein